MNSDCLRESNIPRALRNLQCVARNLISNLRPLQMRLQNLRTLIFHPANSSPSQSDERMLCSRPDRKSAGVVIVEENLASLCPRSVRVHAGRLDGKEQWPY